MPKLRRLVPSFILLMALMSALLPTFASSVGQGFITGTVYYDKNTNGRMDPAESGLSGVELTLMRDEDDVQSLRSNEDGSFAFNNLADGIYTIRARLPEGQIPTSYLADGSALIPSSS